MPDLLIELLSEEIPARMQEFAANELKKNMLSFLADQGVSEIAATAYSTPRRLTLFMSGLPEKAPDINEERKGPRIDAPQQAVDGFLRSVDLNLDQLEVKRDGNVDKYFASIFSENARITWGGKNLNSGYPCVIIFENGFVSGFGPR